MKYLSGTNMCAASGGEKYPTNGLDLAPFLVELGDMIDKDASEWNESCGGIKKGLSKTSAIKPKHGMRQPVDGVLTSGRNKSLKNQRARDGNQSEGGCDRSKRASYLVEP